MGPHAKSSMGIAKRIPPRVSQKLIAVESINRSKRLVLSENMQERSYRRRTEVLKNINF
jgi:hypothetical protein